MAPDMLSRPPGANHRKGDNTDVVLLPSSMFITTTNTEDNTLKKKVKKAQQEHRAKMVSWCDSQGVRKLPEGYVQGQRLAVPSELVLRHDLLAQFHNTPTAGHPGRDNTTTLIAQHYWWPGMKAWVERYIAGCAQCQQNKICTTKKKTPLFHISGNPTMHPFNSIALDLIIQLPKANSHDAILNIVDQGCSRAATFIPCNTMITGEGVVLLYLKHLFPWFRVPSKVISDRDPCFTSHFAWALTAKLKIGRNISTAFHPQTNGLTRCKNQWVEQYLHLYTSARQDDWDTWLPIATFVHNCWPNATTKHSLHKILLGYHPSTAEEPTPITNSETVEAWHHLIKEHRTTALQALNDIAQMPPQNQHQVGDWVWLKAKHLTLPYASAKLAPKCHGPFKIMSEVSPVAYQLKLQRAWTIHDVFHSSLLMPCKETEEHGAQFQCPLPELIGNEEEYKVEQIINHRYHGKWCQLQYLICWKGYSAMDDTWEPTDQVHADNLVTRYHLKYPWSESKYKTTKKAWARSTTLPAQTCLQSTLQMSHSLQLYGWHGCCWGTPSSATSQNTSGL